MQGEPCWLKSWRPPVAYWLCFDELPANFDWKNVMLSISCHMYLLVGSLSILPARKHQDRKKQLFLNEAQILKSMHDKYIVVMKAVCENPLAMMLEYVFFDFAPFWLDGCVSPLQDYCNFISAREEMVSSLASSHIRWATRQQKSVDNTFLLPFFSTFVFL